MDLSQPKKYKLFPSYRLVIAAIMFTGITLVMTMFTSMNFAWVCMVNSTSPENYSEVQGGNLLNWGKKEQRFIFSAWEAGGFVALLLSGLIITPLGSKRIVILGFVLQIISTALIPIAAPISFIFVTFLRVVVGFGGAFQYPAMWETCANWAAESERGTILALTMMGKQFGGLISQGLDGLECKYLSWPWVFYLVSIVGFIFLLIWILFYSNDPSGSRFVPQEETDYIISNRKPKEVKETVKPKVPYKDILLSTGVWATCVASGCGGFLGFLTAYFPTYYEEVSGLDVRKNGLFSSLPYASMLLGRIISGPLSDKKFGFKTHEPAMKIFNSIAFIGSAGCMFGLTFITAESPIYIPVILLTTLYFFLAFVTGGFFKSPFYMAPQFSGVIGSYVSSSSTGIAIIVPYIVSALTPNGTAKEWHNVFYTGTGISLLGALGFLIFGKGTLASWAKTVTPSVSTEKITETAEAIAGTENNSDDLAKF